MTIKQVWCFIRLLVTLTVISQKLRVKSSYVHLLCHISRQLLVGQAQNRHAENLLVEMARPWFKIFSPNVAIQQKSFWHGSYTEICSL